MTFNFDWDCVSAGAPYVTVSSLGLALNTPSINMIGSPDNVVIGFDERNLTIGIRKADAADSAKSYKFKSRIKNGWVRLGCKEFINYLSELSGISFSPAIRYIAKHDPDEDILYITISDTDNASKKQTM